MLNWPKLAHIGRLCCQYSASAPDYFAVRLAGYVAQRTARC